MKKYLSAFVCGFGAGVLQVVPVAKSFSCCLIIPAAAILALLLDQRAQGSTGKISFQKGLVMGLLTGIYAALFGSFFDIFITLVTKNNDIVAGFPEIQKMTNSFPLFAQEAKTQVINMFSSMRDDILNHGFSLIYSSIITISNLVVNSIFGTIGGLIGVQIINSRIDSSSEE